jgi:4-alpha-glucanotransferase
VEALVAAESYWIGDWARAAGPAAISDQVRFTREWSALRRHAAARGVSIIGDMPFYVAPGSADVASHPELFQRGEVAGVPPDDWAVDGQRWGNPLYDWRAMRAEQFRWWVERMRRMRQLVDVTRIDHFRGFVAYWSIPEHHRTARYGRWRRAAGDELFAQVSAELGPIPVIAENLGVITPPVEALRRRFGMPGCTVLQFWFNEQMRNPDRETVDDDVVAYTGTHDNDTTMGWWRRLSPHARGRVDAALADRGIVESRPHWKLLRLAWASNARVAIAPAQDLLGLGNGARMNRPGQVRGNWRWQLAPGQLDHRLARDLRALTEATGRAS